MWSVSLESLIEFMTSCILHSWSRIVINGIRAGSGEATLGFEVFDKRASTSSKIPMVTIQMRGHFSLNKAAYDAMGQPDHVELLYDRQEKLIGFRPTEASNPRAYPVKPQGTRSTGRQVAGQAFAKYYDLDVSTARRYSVEMKDGILVLDLKNESTEVTGPRAAMKSRLAGQ